MMNQAPDPAAVLTIEQGLHSPADGMLADSTAYHLADRVGRTAEVAATWANDVDREARFPEEAFRSARAERLLGLLVPRELGGEGVSISDIVDFSYRLARACSSAGMVFAMHQSSVACLARHGQSSEWHRGLLRRIAEEQLLLASSTTEGTGGGNIRSSASPVERTDAGISLDRAASCVSYGARADGIITTARRSPDSPSSDQVLVAFTRTDYALQPVGGWDSLGMRGTCSSGFALKASGISAQILPEPYERIHVQTMVPFHNLAWAGVWTGIAAAAVERARSFIRHVARRGNGSMPPGAVHFTKAISSLCALRGLIASSVRAYAIRADDADALGSLEFQALMNLTKVETSEMAVATVVSAARACGLAGYLNDSPFSVGRQLRDVLSSPIMISNERILSGLASTALMTPVPDTLRD